MTRKDILEGKYKGKYSTEIDKFIDEFILFYLELEEVDKNLEIESGNIELLREFRRISRELDILWQKLDIKINNFKVS
jgi:hypothetical protein